MGVQIAGNSSGTANWPKVVTVLLILLMCGCVIPRHRAVVNEAPALVRQCVTKHFPSSAYRLASGDILEILYLTIPAVTAKPYRLDVRDQIDVEFAFHPEMNRTVRVRPDGKVSVPRKEDVKVSGLTATEVKKKLTRIYSDLLREPEITVTVREFNAKLDEIQKAIETAPYGQARIITIAPDGNIAVPLVPAVRAAGRTVPELTTALNGRYANILKDIKISVLLREIVGNLIFVDGAVKNPGVFNVKGPTTVQQAIALAAGTTDGAEPRSVLVVSKDPNGKFIARTTDLTRVTSGADYYLGRDDLVYVPKSMIARANVWVEQNISKLLLFNGWSIGLDTELGRQTSR